MLTIGAGVQVPGYAQSTASSLIKDELKKKGGARTTMLLPHQVCLAITASCVVYPCFALLAQEELVTTPLAKDLIENHHQARLKERTINPARFRKTKSRFHETVAREFEEATVCDTRALVPTGRVN